MHPPTLVQKFTDIVRVARSAAQTADTHDTIMAYANEIAAFISGKTKADESEPGASERAQE